MRNSVVILLLVALVSGSCDRNYETYDNYVVLVSFDGCRWDYTDIYDTPHFASMAESGVKAERVISSFPTKTFPNHYTIATGLYPDHHGLISNSFYAPDLDLLYRIGNRDMVKNPGFYGGEPIWNTAEKQGMISASFFWVGSEAPVQGMQPTYWKEYDGSIPFRDRVDSVISWMELPMEERPRLVMLYFQQPDGVGHDFGPVAKETGNVMEEMDDVLGYLRKKIDRLPYGERVNLIVTSDHGMAATSADRYVNMLDHADGSWFDKVVGGNPVYLVDAKDGYDDSLAVRLDGVEGISAWKKEEVPAHLHYGSHSRVSDLVVVADSSWSVGTAEELSGYSVGAHGYDSRNTDMHNIFYAVGPAFKSGYIQSPFENIHIYPLVAHILGLEPADVDGDLTEVEGMLRK